MFTTAACSPRVGYSVVGTAWVVGRSQMSVSLSTRSSKVQRPAPRPRVSLQMRLPYLGLSAEGPGLGAGCVRVRGWSSHSQGAAAVRDHCQIWKSRPSKKRRNFRFPSSSPPTIFCPPLPSRLSSVRVKVSYPDNHPQDKSILLSAARFPSLSSHFIFC